jgi:hypothetical protein
MALLDALRTVGASHTFLGVDPGDRVGEFVKIGDLTNLWVNEGLTVRAVRGDKMRSVSAVFDEFAAAWQFPLYFGQNKDAFADCMGNLPQPPGRGFVVLIVKPDEVLADAPARELEWLVRALNSAADEWGRPIELGEWWDRPAVPFHVVLDVGGPSGSAARKQWSRVGAEMQVLPID